MSKEELKAMLDAVAKKESFMTNPPKPTGFIMIRYEDGVDCMVAAYNRAISDAMKLVDLDDVSALEQLKIRD